MLISDTGMLKVTDFGTSRFLEIAAHGTTVIGSPPYMAPEQFYGKAVFASDVYSVGVTIYQMLTGSLPYDTPAPGRHRAAGARRAPDVAAAQEPEDPEGDQRHRAARDGAGFDDPVSARRRPDERSAGRARAGRRRPTARARQRPGSGDAVSEIQSRLKARATPQASFCWHCRKPLQARTAKCPFCGEAQ